MATNPSRAKANSRAASRWRPRAARRTATDPCVDLAVDPLRRGERRERFVVPSPALVDRREHRGDSRHVVEIAAKPEGDRRLRNRHPRGVVVAERRGCERLFDFRLRLEAPGADHARD
jgi:hypothetical protein